MRCLFALLALSACSANGKPPIYTNKIQGAIGGSCASDAECETGTCMTANFIGYRGMSTGGYCTRSCSADDECAPGKCVDGFDKKYCVARCDKPSNCRDDYGCDAFNQYCEPIDALSLSCDPKAADGAFCSAADGTTGGCIRTVLGDGPAGFCQPGCDIGRACTDSKLACRDIQASLGGGAFSHDTFEGFVCLTPDPAPLTAAGGPCTRTSQCVSGALCVTGTTFECRMYCRGSFDCKGAACNLAPGETIGYCDL